MTSQLVRIVTQTTDADNKSQSTVVVLLDVIKAFDQVCHEAMINSTNFPLTPQ